MLGREGCHKSRDQDYWAFCCLLLPSRTAWSFSSVLDICPCSFLHFRSIQAHRTKTDCIWNEKQIFWKPSSYITLWHISFLKLNLFQVKTYVFHMFTPTWIEVYLLYSSRFCLSLNWHQSLVESRWVALKYFIKKSDHF